MSLIAVVAGASRGAGRGVARELGAAGATVYVTGRTTRDRPATTYGSMLAAIDAAQMPGTIDDTAEEVRRAGGKAIAVRCDHGDPAAVADLFARVEREAGRLDLLVNNAWGGHEGFDERGFGAPFWEQPLAQWESMIDRGVRLHLITARAAAPLLVRQRRGLIVAVSFWDRDRYLRGNVFYDLAKSGLNRLAFAFAEELRPHGVTSLALSPGFMRTELVLAHARTDESRFREVPMLAKSETPRYLGRAVVALARDPEVASLSGHTLLVADLARRYGFTDVDGTQPEAFSV
jgi:NAD(P)-dependent dehydrogenase (short-subunit alcohol dehydrogenase family)